MPATLRTLRAMLSVGVALAGAVGCLVVSPLDPLPEAVSSETTGGKSNGTSGGGTASGNVIEGGASAGEAGEPSSAGQRNSNGECRSTADCAQPTPNRPYFCRPSDHTCVPLTSDTCPLFYGKATDPNAIYFGAFATLNPAAPEDNSTLWAHRVALDELSGDQVGGLPGAPKAPRRPLVMVVCDNADDDSDQGLAHLANDVQVPAIIATLKPGPLHDGFEKYRGRDIFYLSPVTVTSSVVNEVDDGLIWSLLGQPSDLAPTYAALLKLAERYVRSDRTMPDGAPLKVALVTTTAAFDSDTANSVGPLLRFNNDQTALANGSNYLSVKIDSTNPQLDTISSDIVNFGPDVIVSAASELFSMDHGLLQSIEENWEGMQDKPRPFYILSPYNAGDLNRAIELMNDLIGSGTEAHPEHRFVGVSVAGPRDVTLENRYVGDLHALFKDAYWDTANDYDAIYFLAYAMYGVGTDTKLTGPAIAQAMHRLLSGPSYTVGPEPMISKTFDALSIADSTIHLASTLGPPELDAATGTRAVDGSVFCFAQSDLRVQLHTDDALRYDPDKHELTGKFPCFTSFFP